MRNLTRWLLAVLAVTGLKGAVAQAQPVPTAGRAHFTPVFQNPDVLQQSGTKTDGVTQP